MIWQFSYPMSYQPDMWYEKCHIIIYNYVAGYIRIKSILTAADDGSKQRYINNENWSDRKTWISEEIFFFQKRQNNCEELNTRFHAKFLAVILKIHITPLVRHTLLHPIFSRIHVFRFDQLSLLMYRCLLPSSATVKMDNEENTENARYETPLWTKD
jgi:hypothetical protein